MAEIMVVLFIMTIILAAFAPLMTVRAKATSRTSPWNWATPDSANTYFGVHPNQRVMIGQKTKGDDIANKLTINTFGEQSHMLFKKDGTAIAQMYLDEKGNMLLGANPENVPVPTTSDGGNVAVGYGALANLTGGIYNTAIGYQSLYKASTGTYAYEYPKYNIAVGYQALYNNKDGENNIAIGNQAMYNHISSDGNIAIGEQALYNNSGYYNVVVGNSSLKSNTSGQHNIALGSDVLAYNTSGSCNLAITKSALYYNTTGRYNDAIGYGALFRNTTGSYNTSLGYYTLYDNSTGSYNTALGAGACDGITTSNNTCLGAYSGPNNTVTTANNVYIGNRYSNVYVYGTTELKTLIASSDVRLKNIQGENKDGLEKIKQIKPVNFTFKDDKKKTPRVGVIAQDLKKIFPKAVMKGDDGFLKIRQEDMFYAMINAIKELANRDDAKDKKIKELEARIHQLEKLYQPLK